MPGLSSWHHHAAVPQGVPRKNEKRGAAEWDD